MRFGMSSSLLSSRYMFIDSKKQNKSYRKLTSRENKKQNNVDHRFPSSSFIDLAIWLHFIHFSILTLLIERFETFIPAISLSLGDSFNLNRNQNATI